MLGREVFKPHNIWLRTAEVTREAKDTPEFVHELQANLQHAHQVARLNLHSTRMRQKKVYDLQAREKSYNVGDLLLVRVSSRKKEYSPKLQAPWQGPFVVTECLGPVLYRVKDRRSERVLHHDRPQPYLSDHIPTWMQQLRRKYTGTEEGSLVPKTVQEPVVTAAEVSNPSSSDNNFSKEPQNLLTMDSNSNPNLYGKKGDRKGATCSGPKSLYGLTRKIRRVNFSPLVVQKGLCQAKKGGGGGGGVIVLVN